MIRSTVIYDDFGKILRRKSGAESGVILTAENSGFNYVYFDDVPDIEGKYVVDGQLVDLPDQPSDWHDFNYETRQWELNLHKAKSRKWSEIKQERNQVEFGTFDWGGYTFQCDEVSQRRIQGAVQLAAIDSTMTLDWTLSDNTVQTFTAAEYVQIGQALANHVSQCHERGRILRQQIQSATTQAELEAIVW